MTEGWGGRKTEGNFNDIHLNRLSVKFRDFSMKLFRKFMQIESFFKASWLRVSSLYDDIKGNCEHHQHCKMALLLVYMGL